MAARFTTLANALDKGLESLKTDAAVKQIEYWENELKDVEVSGVKGLLHDLESLKKKLQANPVDGHAVKTLLVKIGGETVRVAGRSDEKLTDKLKEVGEKLETAGE